MCVARQLSSCVLLTYNEVVSHFQVHIGDYVKLCPSNPTVPLYICKVISMWENVRGEKMFHGRWMRCGLFVAF